MSHAELALVLAAYCSMWGLLPLALHLVNRKPKPTIHRHYGADGTSKDIS